MEEKTLFVNGLSLFFTSSKYREDDKSTIFYYGDLVVGVICKKIIQNPIKETMYFIEGEI